MKKTQTDFINHLGIGAFAFISISEFCGLLQYLIESVLIITKINAKIIIWLPQVITLILFSILVIWAIDKFNKLVEIDTRKTLKRLIILSFGILASEFLLVYLGTDFLIEYFPVEYEYYLHANKGSLIFRSFLAFIPIFQYVLFGMIFLLKGKPGINNDQD